MTHQPSPAPGRDQPMVYEIRVKGRMGPRWAGRFDRMTITLDPHGNTLLTGPVTDQAALHGMLTTIRDLGLPLLSISRVHPGTDRTPRKELE